MIESITPRLQSLFPLTLCLITLIVAILGAAGIVHLTFFFLSIIFGFPAYYSLCTAKKYFLNENKLIVKSLFGLRKKTFLLKDIKYYTIKLKSSRRIKGYADLTIYTDYGSCNLSSFGFSNFEDFYLALTEGRTRNFELEEKWLRRNKISVSLFYLLLPLTIWVTMIYVNFEEGFLNWWFFLFTAILMIPIVVYFLELLNLTKRAKK